MSEGTPRPRRRPSSRRRDPLAVPPALARAVVAAVADLEAAGGGDAAVGREVDRRLRTAVEPHLDRFGRTGRIVALVRLACAQLAVGDVAAGLAALHDARARLDV